MYPRIKSITCGVFRGTPSKHLRAAAPVLQKNRLRQRVIGIGEVDLLVASHQNAHGARHVAQWHPVDVGKAENGAARVVPFAHLRANGETPRRSSRAAILKKRHSQPHLAGGAGGVKRVRPPGRTCLRSSMPQPSSVDGNRSADLSAGVLRHGNVHTGRACPH